MCVVRLLFVLFYVVFVCKCVLPPGDNPIAVNKYIINYVLKFTKITQRKRSVSVQATSINTTWSILNREINCSYYIVQNI
jgi:hypothetical protein